MHLLLVWLVTHWMILSVEATGRPIIGILSQEPNLGVDKHFPEYKSYIPASYIKSVEGAGARVVPLFIGRSEAYYRKILGQINGVLIPGGGASFYSKEDGYAKAAIYIYHIAEELNSNGDNFPILGICLGFQVLLFASNNNNEIRTRCDCYYENMALVFMPDFRQSLLFSHAPLDILQKLSTAHITHNWHVWCITPTNFTEQGLHKNWNILSTNSNKRGLKFISSAEHKIYPFAGVQFHPEKNSYEWKITQDNPHSRIAIDTARHFFDWLVNQARGNHHYFNTEEEEKSASIHNYWPIFTAYMPGIGFDQIYLFNKTNE